MPMRRLHIACFLYEFPALSETFVLNQLVGLLEAGHEVAIFAERPRAEEKRHGDVGRYRLVERTCYLDMPQAKSLRLLLALPLFVRLLFRDPGRALAALRVDRYGAEARSLRLLYWLDRLSRRGRRRYDAIHCHFGTNGRLAAILRELGAIDGPLATTFHGVDVSAVLRSDPRHYRHLFRRGELFLPISERWRQGLAEAGCPPARIAVHRMGVDLERFPFRSGARLAGPLRLLGIGRLVEKKGFDDALTAVAGLLARGIDAHYDIVGDGPLRRALTDRVAELGIGRHVTFHGWLEQDSVRRLMTAGDVLLAPSVTDRSGDQEGIPVTLMEAMAIGLPVVSTWHSGIPELVQDGESGILVPERAPLALEEALLELARRPELRRRLSERARRRVEAEFDIEVLNRRLEARLAALADGRIAAAAAGELPPLPDRPQARAASA